MAKHPLLPTRVRVIARERPWIQRSLWRFEAFLVWLLWGVAAQLPPDRASALGRAVGRWLGPRGRKSKHVRRNLGIALPELGPQELSALTAEVWGSYGAVLAEFPHFARIASEGRLEVVTQGGVRALREPGRPAVIVTAHMANWQLVALATAKFERPLAASYTPDPNPYIDRQIQRFRGALECRMIESRGGARALVRELAAGQILGMAVDFRVDDGEPIPWFGVPAPTTLAPARLALRHRCELIPVRVERLDRKARFRITFFDPIVPDDATAPPREQARQMTRKINELFEGWIRERPEQWMCGKRRFSKETLKALDAAVFEGADPTTLDATTGPRGSTTGPGG